MKIKRIAAGVYAANCYIIHCEDTKEGIVVDPGGGVEDILAYIRENDIEVKHIVLTHGHGDHIGGVKELKDSLDLTVLAHEDELELLKDPEKNLSSIMWMGPISLSPDKVLRENDEIIFGNEKALVIHTPGHSEGGISLKLDGYLITGDSLFKNSIGRTDLYGGDYDRLIESINKKLMIYDDDTIILAGHGETSTIANEKSFNKFL